MGSRDRKADAQADHDRRIAGLLRDIAARLCVGALHTSGSETRRHIATGVLYDGVRRQVDLGLSEVRIRFLPRSG